MSLNYVDRTGDDGYSGQVLQVAPTSPPVARGGARRGQHQLHPTIAVGIGDTDPKFLTHGLFGNGRLEAVENRFFIGADARAGLNGANSSAETVDAINFNSANGQQSYSFGITPEYRQHSESLRGFRQQQPVRLGDIQWQ